LVLKTAPLGDGSGGGDVVHHIDGQPGTVRWR